VSAGLSGIDTLSRALAVDPPRSRSRLYWQCRICLVTRASDLPVFDRVFDAVFGAVLGADPQARRGRRTPGPSRPEDRYAAAPGADHAAPTTEEQGGGARWLTVPAVVAVDEQSPAPGGSTVPDLLPSALAGDARTPLPRLDPDRLADLERWFGEALATWPARRSRRTVPVRGGHPVALRETMARARRSGWETVVLTGRRSRRRPRRLVMICDVSRSMRGFAVAYLCLMRAATTVTQAEAYAFSTRLTRLTPALRAGSAADALRAAAEEVGDVFGGTRIASSLGELLRSHRGHELRGAVVLLASDGWDSDEPDELRTAMARLHRRAHRVIWLNPRAAAPGYRPVARGMAAALPYCDVLLPAHTAEAMLDVVRAVVTPDAVGRRVRPARVAITGASPPRLRPSPPTQRPEAGDPR
jgi:hypothetical protein